MSMKQAILFFVFIILNISARGIALGDWQNKTPGGSTMGDNGSGPKLVLESPYRGISGINSWYFYKEHIIIKAHDGFFVLNEAKKEVVTFKSEKQWREYLEQSKLVPAIWTRWYSDNWKFYERLLLITILVACLLVWTFIFGLWYLLRPLVKNGYKVQPEYFLIFLMVLLLAVLRYQLDNYPQSF
jgi:hypothetical protein